MGGLTTILIAYFLGGVTLVPLIAAVLFLHGFYLLPRRHDANACSDSDYVPGGILEPGDDKAPLEAARKAAASEPKARVNQDSEVAAGYFAVCREYTPMGINAKPIERSTPVGSTTVAPMSPSVYQTMYRSIFDRKPTPGGQDASGLSQRPKKAGNVFYVVLRHGHLMLFDDEEQLEVRHVVSLAHHDISIYSGGDTTPEGELFIKRNALCLSCRPDASDQTPDSQTSKPFYLFSENCSAKEDFYFALLKNQEQAFGQDASAPKPKHFDVKNIISLVQRLHSSEDHVHSRWLNALLGRIFLALYKTRDLENFIRDKITSKISRVKRPSFLTDITIQGIDTGEAAPYFTNLKLRDLTVEGECVVEADVKYTGNFRIQVGATVKIDLGTRFKAREVNLVLAVLLKRLEGHVLFKLKTPPSNRLWFSFQSMPKMEMAIEPIVSSRQITYTVILRQIENRIKEVFAETLVLPFWDDVPFSRTEHKRWRGGIFESDDAVENTSSVDASEDGPRDEVAVADGAQESAQGADDASLPPALEKSHSTPLLEQQPEKVGLSSRVLEKIEDGSSMASVASAGSDAKSSATSPLRSPSILKNSTDPIVGTETAHADLFKPCSSPPDHATNFMAALQSRAHDVFPRHASAGSPMKSHNPLAKVLKPGHDKEGGDGEKTDDASTTSKASSARRNTASSVDSSLHGEASNADATTQSSPSGSIKSQTGVLSRGFFLRRENSSATTASNESSTGETKRSTLAAVTSAAAQARQWGWNAIQRQKDSKRAEDKAGQVDLSQPMGRGQPLPPPGVPLPGPAPGGRRVVTMASIAPHRKHTVDYPADEAHQEANREAEHSPSTPTSMKQSRRRGPSLEQTLEAEQKLLVVAAPEDSQPGTPQKEAQLGEAGMAVAAAEAATLSAAPPAEALAGPLAAKSEMAALDAAKVTSASRLVAMPAAETADNHEHDIQNGDDDDDDDGGYAGWLEEGLVDDEEQGDCEERPIADDGRTQR